MPLLEKQFQLAEAESGDSDDEFKEDSKDNESTVIYYYVYSSKYIQSKGHTLLSFH